MNSHERIVAALQGKPVDHLPFCPFLAYVWEHFHEDIRAKGQLAFYQRVGADPLWRGAPCPVKIVYPPDMESLWSENDKGAEWTLRTPVGTIHYAWMKSEVGRTNFIVEHPLKTERDYTVQLWIEEHTTLVADPTPVTDHLAGEGREGLSLGMLIPRNKSAFQSLVEHLAGTEALMYALADFPETVERLWRTMVAKDLEAVRLAVLSPYTHFITWEDSSTQNYSPTQYDAYIGSEIGEWCRILAAHGKHYIQHACGHVNALVERMKAHGVYAIESITPPPTGNIQVAEARQKIGASVGIIGGIEPLQLLRLSEKALQPYVETIIQEAAGGPFVLANSDSCPPGVTISKFNLIAEIVHRIRV